MDPWGVGGGGGGGGTVFSSDRTVLFYFSVNSRIICNSGL